MGRLQDGHFRHGWGGGQAHPAGLGSNSGRNKNKSVPSTQARARQKLYGGSRVPQLGPLLACGGGSRRAFPCSYEHILKSGNLAAPGRIRPPRESSFSRSYGPHLEVRRRDSVKVPKWVRADTVWSTPPIVRDTLLRCDCRQGSRETVRREGMSTRKAHDEMERPSTIIQSKLEYGQSVTGEKVRTKDK